MLQKINMVDIGIPGLSGRNKRCLAGESAVKLKKSFSVKGKKLVLGKLLVFKITTCYRLLI